nr:suberization-associated anionic peroxidase-like [Ipomoea batatas]
MVKMGNLAPSGSVGQRPALLKSASSIVNHTSAFLSDFAATMVKMRNLASSAGVQLEICDVCSIVTPTSMAAM